MYLGSLGWALRQLGRVLDDRNADGTQALYLGSTTSKIRLPRAVEALDEAQQFVFYELLDEDVNREMLAREVALTAVSGDSISYTLTPRAVEVWGMRDSLMGTDDEPYFALPGTRYDDMGYSIGPRGDTIKWHNFTPDSSLTYYVRVCEVPASLVYGGVLQQESASTTMLIADTAEYGDLVLNNDMYNGVEGVIESGTTGKGTEFTITDYANSGSTTTLTLQSAITISSDVKYSTYLTLPRQAYQLVIYKAAEYAAQWAYHDRLPEFQERFNKSFMNTIERLRTVGQDTYHKPWIVRSF